MTKDDPQFHIHSGEVYCASCPLFNAGPCLLQTGQPCPTRETYQQAVEIAAGRKTLDTTKLSDVE